MDSGEIESGGDGWNEFVRRANEFILSGELEERENGYKREVACNLRKARKALLTGTGDLAELVEKGLDSNLIRFNIRNGVRKWMDESLEDASETLRAVWTKDNLSVEQRINAFRERFPREAIGGAAGVLTNLVSVLLMAMDVDDYPPFRITVFQKACRHTGYDPPEGGADEAALYGHFLSFLDRFIEEAKAHGVHLRHRLDAQSLIWRSQEKEDSFALPRLNSTQPPLCDPLQKDWEEFVRHANELIDSGELDGEVKPKIEVGCKFAKALEAVRNDAEDWQRLVKTGIEAARDEKLVFNMSQKKFRDWIDKSQVEGLQALKAIWTKDDLSVDQRIHAFCERFPKEVVGGGAGTRMSVTAQLLMGLDAELHPPFAKKRFENAYNSTGYDLPDRNADEAEQYTHFLRFLDRFIEEARAHGVGLRHRLDAHIVVWLLYEEDALPKLGSRSPEPKTLRELADELLLSTEFLEEINTLLNDKRQVIFQGPPGTGKTYVAQAACKLPRRNRRSGYLGAISSILCLRGFRSRLPSENHGE